MFAVPLTVRPERIRSRFCRFLTLLLLVCIPLAAQPRRVTPTREGKRVALVIGNDNYINLQRLSNSANDARDMAVVLRSLSFDVIEQENANRETFESAVDQFIHQIHPSDIALFYYSGHGMQIRGENYLAAVDLTAQNEIQARNRALKASEILEEMEASGATLNIVILDACRDNPFGSSRSIGGQGLAQMNAGGGALIAYATAPGRVADDNRQGRNGLYTYYLLQALRQPGLPLERVFKTAGAQVQQASGGRQVPWISSSYDGEFYFSEGDHSVMANAAQSVANTVTTGPAPDLEAWEAIRSSKSPELFEQFLREYPSSQYAGAARLKLAALNRAGTSGILGGAPTEAANPPASGLAEGGNRVDPGAIDPNLIIQRCAAKESEFQEALTHYTWRQAAKLVELDSSGKPEGGEWSQVEDIIPAPDGTRTSRVVQAPLSTLRYIIVTPEDLTDLREIQAFFLSSRDVGLYDIRYAGREKIDAISVYRFEIGPKKMDKGKRYFQGTIWVDDRDFQIVKTFGKGVGSAKKGNEFPQFETFREQIDGKYWFPTYTHADDTLHFPNGTAQRIRMIVRYENYKRKD